MKKLIYFLMIIALVFSFAACNDEPPTLDPDDNGTGDNGGNEETKTLDVLTLGYSIVYNGYEPSERQMAEALRDEIKEKTGVSLRLKSHTQEQGDYEIQLGSVSARDECKNILKSLDSIVNSECSAYAVAVKDNMIVITGTSASAIQMAIDDFITLINGKKLDVDKTLDKSYIVFKSNNKTITVDTKEFSSDTHLTSISVNGKKLQGFSADLLAYGESYPSTEFYPSVAAKSLNSKSTVTVVQPKDNNGEAKITVKSEDGSKEAVYTVKFTHSESTSVSAEVVNKNNAKGTLSFVFDDCSTPATADIVVSKLLPKYEGINVSFGMITKYLATATGGTSAGGYTLSPAKSSYTTGISNSIFKGKKYTYTYEYWNEILKTGRAEVISHSYTHDGPTMVSDPYKELKASQEILKKYLNQDALTYVNPGVGNYGDDPTYNDYRVNSGIYIGARAGGSKIATLDWIKKDKKNRFAIPSLAITYHSTNKNQDGTYTTNAESSYNECIAAGISAWTDYVDSAVSDNGWATFCIHDVFLDTNQSKGTWVIYESQLDKLFEHSKKLADSGDLWIATYTEAQIYYNQWSTAVVNAVVEGDDKVTVTLSDSEDNARHKMEMTVKVSVPTTWNEAEFEYNGNSGVVQVQENTDGTKYVYVNLIPDVSSLVLTEK